MDRRWLVPAGAVLGALAALGRHLGPAEQRPPDLRQWWAAGQAVLHGQNAYQAVLALPEQVYPFLYPLTAALPALPFAPLPLVPAHLLWSAIGGALLGWAAIGRPGLGPALCSMAFLSAAGEGQWSPFLVAATALPALAWLWAVKPSVGLAYLAGYGTRMAVLTGLLATAIALAIAPDWPAQWLAALRSTVSVPLLVRPGGFLLLLGFLRWRTPEGRLLGTLALVPQTAVLYEALPVFLCARTKREGYLLAILTFVAAFGPLLAAGHAPDVPTQQARGWPWLLLCCYLPALALVLRPRCRGAHTRAAGRFP